MNNFISKDKLARACKRFVKDLMDKGIGYVDVIDFSAEIRRIADELPREAAIEWNDVEKVGLPLVSDEYIVMIAYADKPTVLYFDAEDGVFFEEKDDEDVAYKVTHWAEMPEVPYV